MTIDNDTHQSTERDPITVKAPAARATSWALMAVLVLAGGIFIIAGAGSVGSAAVIGVPGMFAVLTYLWFTIKIARAQPDGWRELPTVLTPATEEREPRNLYVCGVGTDIIMAALTLTVLRWVLALAPGIALSVPVDIVILTAIAALAVTSVVVSFKKLRQRNPVTSTIRQGVLCDHR